MMNDKIFNHFICASSDYADFDNTVPAPYFRKSFAYNGGEAKLYICVIGFYELYINGTKITKGKLAPYLSNPDDICYYDVYDISRYLHGGNNVIGVLLGNGLCNSRSTVGDFCNAPFRSAPKFALSLFVENEKVLQTDSSFKTHSSPIIDDDYRMGECYDARKEIHDWCSEDFDDRHWNDSLTADLPRGDIRPNLCEPIKVFKCLKPISIREYDGGYLYDFGENHTGICRLNISGEVGQEVTLTHGELVIDGKLSLNNCIHYTVKHRDRIHVDKYILKGDEKETYEPTFTYHGFRYVYMQGITQKQATDDLLTMLCMSTSLERSSDFVCSSEIVNKIQQCTLASDLSNLMHILTDCPHREKQGWTGDVSLSVEQLSLNFNAEAFFVQWYDNLLASQKENGKIPCIVPSPFTGNHSALVGGNGFDWGTGPSWDCVLTTLPYTIYQYYGNTEILMKSADYIEKYIDYSLTRRNEDGLYAYGLGDWCPVGREDCDYPTPLEISDSISHIDILTKAAKIYEIIGDARLEKIKNIREEEIQAFRKKYIKDGVMNCNAQTGLAMALFYGIIEERDKDTVFGQLVDAIHEKDDHFDCGCLGLRVIFRVLADFGKVDLAMKLITQDSFPSYAYPIAHGATSLPETFQELFDGSLVAKNGHNASQNHHFFGDVSGFFISELAGIKINPLLRDVNEVVISPKFACDLHHAGVEYQHKEGKVSVSWHRINNKIHLQVISPEKVHIKFDIGYAYQIIREVNTKSGKEFTIEVDLA